VDAPPAELPPSDALAAPPVAALPPEALEPPELLEQPMSNPSTQNNAQRKPIRDRFMCFTFLCVIAILAHVSHSREQTQPSATVPQQPSVIVRWNSAPRHSRWPLSDQAGKNT
jgi:hypothetical protein